MHEQIRVQGTVIGRQPESIRQLFVPILIWFTFKHTIVENDLNYSTFVQNVNTSLLNQISRQPAVGLSTFLIIIFLHILCSHKKYVYIDRQYSFNVNWNRYQNYRIIEFQLAIWVMYILCKNWTVSWSECIIATRNWLIIYKNLTAYLKRSFFIFIWHAARRMLAITQK